MIGISDTAQQAARAMDISDYGAVQNLFAGLLEAGVPFEDAAKAFKDEGAGLELIPKAWLGRTGYSMLAAVMG